MRVCFFAPVKKKETLEYVEFYKQDIDILHELGFDVTIATRWSEIPWTADLTLPGGGHGHSCPL